tara:strand:+ start:2396 stop:3355 length:960 start_codon:yes stop_codon:yes gene_type:complete
MKTKKRKVNLVSIIFSFRNEENNIDELVKRTSIALKMFPYEMIFVNDNSNDKSLDILSKLMSTHPIKIINMSRRFGVTPCVIAGLQHAKGDAIVYLDSDLQDPPELIPTLIKKFQNGAEVVHTKRISRKGESLFKIYLTKIAYKIINFFSEIELEENAGDFKLLSKRAVKTILELPEHTTYIRGLSVWVGFRQDLVLYDRDARAGGESKFPVLSKGPMMEFFKGLTAFSATPLFLSFLFSIVSILIAFSLVVYGIAIKFLDLSASGIPSILIAMSFFNGVILLALGILGVYIAQIYYEVKNRPKYIIKDIIEKKSENNS